MKNEEYQIGLFSSLRKDEENNQDYIKNLRASCFMRRKRLARPLDLLGDRLEVILSSSRKAGVHLRTTSGDSSE